MDNRLNALLSNRQSWGQFAPEVQNALADLARRRDEELSQSTIVGNGDTALAVSPQNTLSVLTQPRQQEQLPVNALRNNLTGATYNLQSQTSGPELDYSSPIEYGGMGKGYRVKGDPFTAILGDGTKISLGVDRAASRAAQMEDLKLKQAQEQLRGASLENRQREAQLGDAGTVNQDLLQKRFGKLGEGWRWTASGQAEKIPGYEGSKMPTEDQAKNRQLYERTTQQLPIVIKNFDALGNISDQLGAKTGLAPLTSKEYQSADAALKDIAASYLYSVSGATANPGEVANLTDTLRPRIGESAETKAEKKARLEQMVNSIRARAFPGDTSSKPVSSASPTMPDVGAIMNGYRFKGGNPADQSSWERVQ